MPTYSHGRHEHGQNFLSDRKTIKIIVDLVRATRGPIIEIGAGNGALTRRLATLGRPLTAVEIDTSLAQQLRGDLGRRVTVENTDFLTYRLPRTPHVLAGNLPFHQTTAILRHLLHSPGWIDAVLLVQWEVARRRAGVGTSTMMTAQWAPWFTFTLHGRVPAGAFRPRPGVDGGLIAITRIDKPQLANRDKRPFQAMVHRVYTGPGRGLAQILSRTTTIGDISAARRWLARHRLAPNDLPDAMPTSAWIDLYRTSGTSPPPRQPRRSCYRGAGR